MDNRFSPTFEIGVAYYCNFKMFWWVDFQQCTIKEMTVCQTAGNDQLNVQEEERKGKMRK